MSPTNRPNPQTEPRRPWSSRLSRWLERSPMFCRVAAASSVPWPMIREILQADGLG